MKTAVTITEAIQSSPDWDYDMVSKTKTFSDESTLKEIKEWIIKVSSFDKSTSVDDVSISRAIISDVID